MKICVVGAGYVGLTTAVCFAEMGHTIRLIDVDQEKIEKIREGVAPIYEEGLQELLTKNREKIEAISDYDFDEDIIFICVGTPSRPDGKIDLRYVTGAAESIAKKMREGSVVVVKSTVFPGTTEGVVAPIIREHCPDFGIAMNPEFLREGKAIHDFLHPDRVVIGVSDGRGEDVLRELYEPLHAPILITTPTEAEMIKYASNALLATKISFANEVGNVCKMLGIDTHRVMEGVGMDHRISPHFLNAGMGFGGSCFPKDLRGIYGGAKELGYEMEIIKAVLDVNEKQPMKVVEILEKYMEITGKVIAVLGLAFKADTDDVRESRSIPLIRALREKGAVVRAYDPMATENMRKIIPDIVYCRSVAEALQDADACVIATDWKEFEYIDFSPMKNTLVVEGRRILKKREGITYEGVCW